MYGTREGTCSQWSVVTGEGILTSGDDSITVHRARLQSSRNLKVGDRVRFDLGDDDRNGLTAINVRLIARADTINNAPSIGSTGLGSCVKWDADRGFGFLAIAAGGSLFVHRSGLMDARELRVGDQVRYVVARDHRTGKLCGQQVQLLDRAESSQQWRPNLSTRSMSERTVR